MATPTLLSAVSSTLLPPTVTAPIFEKTEELSAVQRLARRVPLSVDATTAIPVSMDIPVAGWVAEAGSKPVGAGGVGVKTMTGKKLALLVPVSAEVASTNPAGLYAQLRNDLPTAMARAFDYACIHGLDLRTGGTGPFANYLTQNASAVELGTGTNQYVDLVTGMQNVTNAGYDFSGYACDPRLRPSLMLELDGQNRPLWVDAPQSGINAGVLTGYPAVYNRGISGTYRRHGNRVQVVTITGTPTGGTFTLSLGGATTTALAYNASAATVQTAVRALGALWAAATVTGSAGGPYTVTLAVLGGATAEIIPDGSSLTGGTSPTVTVARYPDLDTDLRAIGGDWSQCAWGQGMDITVKVSDVASYVDENGSTHSAFQENLVLLLVEAYYGFVTSDAIGAFVAYSDAVAES
jgi:hypothetical protein